MSVLSDRLSAVVPLPEGQTYAMVAREINLNMMSPNPDMMARIATALEQFGSIAITKAQISDFPGYCALAIGWGGGPGLPSRERYEALERVWAALKQCESGQPITANIGGVKMDVLSHCEALDEACEALRKLEKE